MSDHFDSSLEDRTNGEEYWSAAEEFCSCQRDGYRNNQSLCTCNGEGDDHDERDESEEYEYFCICIPTHPRESVDSGDDLLNTGTQYDSQLSFGSGDDKVDSENVQSSKHDEVSVIQGISQTRASIKKAEGDSQTTRENNNVVNTKSVGLVLGNRQLASVTGSARTSVTDHDNNSEILDNRGDSIPLESDYQESDHDKTAEKMFGVHEDSPRRVCKHNKRLDRVKMKTKFLSHKHKKSTRERDNKDQGTRFDHRKDNVNEFSTDQSGTEISNPREDLPTNQSRDESELLRESMASMSLSAQENRIEPNPYQLTKKPDDLMILVKSNVPVSTSIEEMNANVSVSIHRHKDKINNEAVSEEKDKEINFDQENRARLLSQRHKNNHDTDAEGKDEGLCDRCSKHQYEPCFEQRGNTRKEELETPKDTPIEHTKNCDTSGDQLYHQHEQAPLVETEGSEKAFTQIPKNRQGDKMKSVQFSVLGLSHLKAGRVKAAVNPTSATRDFISTRVDELEGESIPEDADGKERRLDGENCETFDSSIYPLDSVREGNTGYVQRKYIEENLHTNNSRNSGDEKQSYSGDEKQSYSFIEGTIQTFVGELDEERHTRSSQTNTENATVKRIDKIVENKTQDGVRFFEYINASYCDGKAGDISKRDSLQKGLKTNSTNYCEATETDLSVKPKRISSVQSDSPNTLQTVDEFPSNQSLTYILSSPSKARTPQKNTTKKYDTLNGNILMQTKHVSSDKSDNPKALQKDTINEYSSNQPQTKKQDNRPSPMFGVEKLEMEETKNEYDEEKRSNISMETKNTPYAKSYNQNTFTKKTVDECPSDQSRTSKQHSPISKVEKFETDGEKKLTYDNTGS
nr:putative leucine-rich repeat-containing protein DDB_G0290503 [Lytechinus pictus]